MIILKRELCSADWELHFGYLNASIWLKFEWRFNKDYANSRENKWIINGINLLRVAYRLLRTKGMTSQLIKLNELTENPTKNPNWKEMNKLRDEWIGEVNGCVTRAQLNVNCEFNALLRSHSSLLTSSIQSDSFRFFQILRDSFQIPFRIPITPITNFNAMKFHQNLTISPFSIGFVNH